MAFHCRTIGAGVLAAGIALASAACGEDSVAPQPVTFTVQVIDEEFTIRATDPATIAALEDRRLSGQSGVIMGELATGDGGFNDPWSWHLEPGTIQVPDVAIELCDGRPSMVEADTDYWIGTVGRFCPWDARVIGRSN